MPLFELSDVDPVAVTICKKGANGQRIFLKKSEDNAELHELPHEQRILKAADWSAFYCVVAEPGRVENGGMLNPDAEDVWASEDEIRKAAHRFARNGGTITRLHESLEPYGTMVENAVALADFDVPAPDGSVATIKKGTWYIAIEPTPDGKAAVESGEFTGVSLEGTGLRRLKKSHAGENVAGPVRHLVRHYMKKPHPFTACVRDNTKRFGQERAERICATLKDMGTGTHDWRGGSIKKSDEDAVVSAFAESWYAAGLTDQDAGDYLSLVREAETEDDRSLLRKLAEKVGIKAYSDDDGSLPAGAGTLSSTPEEDLTEMDAEKLETLMKSVESQTEAVGKLTGTVENLVNTIIERTKASEKREETAPDAESLKKSLEEFTDKVDEKLTEFGSDLERLAAGGTSQTPEPDTIKKQTDDPLAGIFN